MSDAIAVERDEYGALAALTYAVEAFMRHHEYGDHMAGDCPLAYDADGEPLTDATGMRCDYVEQMARADARVREWWGALVPAASP